MWSLSRTDRATEDSAMPTQDLPTLCQAAANKKQQIQMPTMYKGVSHIDMNVYIRTIAIHQVEFSQHVFIAEGWIQILIPAPGKSTTTAVTTCLLSPPP